MPKTRKTVLDNSTLKEISNPSDNPVERYIFTGIASGIDAKQVCSAFRNKNKVTEVGFNSVSEDEAEKLADVFDQVFKESKGDLAITHISFEYLKEGAIKNLSKLLESQHFKSSKLQKHFRLRLAQVSPESISHIIPPLMNGSISKIMFYYGSDRWLKEDHFNELALALSRTKVQKDLYLMFDDSYNLPSDSKNRTLIKYLYELLRTWNKSTLVVIDYYDRHEKRWVVYEPSDRQKLEGQSRKPSDYPTVEDQSRKPSDHRSVEEQSRKRRREEDDARSDRSVRPRIGSSRASKQRPQSFSSHHPHIPETWQRGRTPPREYPQQNLDSSYQPMQPLNPQALSQPYLPLQAPENLPMVMPPPQYAAAPLQNFPVHPLGTAEQNPMLALMGMEVTGLSSSSSSGLNLPPLLPIYTPVEQQVAAVPDQLPASPSSVDEARTMVKTLTKAQALLLEEKRRLEKSCSEKEKKIQEVLEGKLETEPPRINYKPPSAASKKEKQKSLKSTAISLSSPNAEKLERRKDQIKILQAQNRKLSEEIAGLKKLEIELDRGLVKARLDKIQVALAAAKVPAPVPMPQQPLFLPAHQAAPIQQPISYGSQLVGYIQQQLPPMNPATAQRILQLIQTQQQLQDQQRSMMQSGQIQSQHQPSIPQSQFSPFWQPGAGGLQFDPRLQTQQPPVFQGYPQGPANNGGHPGIGYSPR